MAYEALVKQTFEELNTGFQPSEHQIKALKACCERQHSFVTLPTGYGKSYVFLGLPKLLQLARGIMDAIIVVVCPLVSLMSTCLSGLT